MLWPALRRRISGNAAGLLGMCDYPTRDSFFLDDRNGASVVFYEFALGVGQGVVESFSKNVFVHELA